MPALRLRGIMVSEQEALSGVIGSNSLQLYVQT